MAALPELGRNKGGSSLIVANEMLSLANELCSSLGMPNVSSMERMSGGKNNQIYQLKTGDGALVILKKYNSHPNDPRDRLGAEWNFLRSIWDSGVRKTPEPLAVSRKENLALFTFINGAKLIKGNVLTEHVKQAAQFIVDINSRVTHIDKMASASEACFSLEEHLNKIDHRVKRLRDLDIDAPLFEEANNFIIDELLPAWKELYHLILKKCTANMLREPSKGWISPSDFGFHNALVDDHGVLKFIDFEYAGRDDLAKLVNDFFCCPEIVVPPTMREVFIEKIATDLKLPDSFVQRCELLFKAYKIKWICIILNDFLTDGSRRRDFAGYSNRDERCKIQLSKAINQYVEIQA